MISDNRTVKKLSKNRREPVVEQRVGDKQSVVSE